MDVTAPDRTPANGGLGRNSDKIGPVSDLISIDDARGRVLDAVTRLGDEDVPLDLALGREKNRQMARGGIGAHEDEEVGKLRNAGSVISLC